MRENNGLDAYLEEVGQYLSCSASEKKVILEQIRSVLLDTPGVEEMTLEELKEVLDPPEALAEAHMEDKKTKEILASLKSKRITRIILCVAAALVVLGVGAYLITEHIKSEQYRNGFVIERITRGDPRYDQYVDPFKDPAIMEKSVTY